MVRCRRPAFGAGRSTQTIRVWDILLASQTPLTEYFARIGLLLVVDEPEKPASSRAKIYDGLPKLSRARLGYDETLLCVLLHKELRRFEDEDLDNDRCGIDATQLFEQWQAIAPSQHDDACPAQLSAALGKLEDSSFVRKYSDEPEAWEIRRILKAQPACSRA